MDIDSVLAGVLERQSGVPIKAVPVPRLHLIGGLTLVRKSYRHIVRGELRMADMKEVD